MKCSYCPLFTRYESEDDCYEVCGLFGDGWDNRFQYEDKEGTTIGCYIEKCYITKRAKQIDEHNAKMANYHKVEENDMFISKRKLNEKIREALEREERERYIHEKIDRIDRDWSARFDGLQRYCFELEKKIATLLEEKRLG